MRSRTSSSSASSVDAMTWAAPSGSRGAPPPSRRSEEHTSELQSREKVVCRLPLEKEMPPFAVQPVTAVAEAVVAVLVAVSWRYGYHRDELYYLQQSAHLAWGSVDSGFFF